MVFLVFAFFGMVGFAKIELFYFFTSTTIWYLYRFWLYRFYVHCHWHRVFMKPCYLTSRYHDNMVSNTMVQWHHGILQQWRFLVLKFLAHSQFFKMLRGWQFTVYNCLLGHTFHMHVLRLYINFSYWIKIAWILTGADRVHYSLNLIRSHKISSVLIRSHRIS